MMKKLLVLTLVLGLASAANAVLIDVDGQRGATAEVPETGIATITVVSEDAAAYLGYIILEAGGGGVLSAPEVLPGAGDLGSAVAYVDEPEWGLGFELTIAASPSGAIAAGDQVTLTYTGQLGDTAQISLFVDPEYGTPAASVGVTVVPEPMTVLLLGLGGLFLRRRK
jgi:hypothetical protein